MNEFVVPYAMQPLATAMQEASDWPALRLFSQFLGWTYFCAWSVSFYPQVILNYRRKSVVGLSLDFLYLNLVGFLFYTVYNVAFYYSTGIQDEYARRHGNGKVLVQLNDVVFGMHATIITALTVCQTFIYQRDDTHRRASFALTILPFVFIVFAIVIVLAWSGALQWIDALYYMGGVKVFISLCKYLPQLLLNYQRKSTVGWSIGNILLDFTGGTLSLAQQFVDAFLCSDMFSCITGNYAKFLLGSLSMTFDIAFMIQHYVLYRGARDAEEAEEDVNNAPDGSTPLLHGDNGQDYGGSTA